MTDTQVLDTLIEQVITQTVPGDDACESGEWQCRLCNDCRCPERDLETVQRIVGAGANRVGSTIGVKQKPAIAALIDHTLLKPDATQSEIETLCREADLYSFASVSVNPVWVAVCRNLLKSSPVKIGVTIGFPLGATTTHSKVEEARMAVAEGASEIDMVMNIGYLKSGFYDKVEADIRAVVEVAEGRPVKVILETALLTDEQKIKACVLAKRAGAHFVKTSTGFSTGGATVHDVALMRKVVGDAMGVKAAGGIKSSEEAEKLIAAGASRIGASASIAIAAG